MIYEVNEASPWLVEESQRDLRERTKEFALRIIRMFSALPKTTEAKVLGKQILRSGTSVCANYREATRARSDAEFVSKIGDCLKELEDEAQQRGDGGMNAARLKRGEHFRVPSGRKCEQTAYWLELFVDSGIVPESRLFSLTDECHQLTAIFASIVKSSPSSTS